RSYVLPGTSTGPAAAYRQAVPSPMKKRTAPEVSVFSHHPRKLFSAAAMVRSFGTIEGRTSTSTENGAAVQTAFAGIWTYSPLPSSKRAVSPPAASRPADTVGIPTDRPSPNPRWSNAVEPASSKRQYEVGASASTALGNGVGPAAFDAATTTRSVLPTSLLVRRYDAAVAPGTSTQP